METGLSCIRDSHWVWQCWCLPFPQTNKQKKMSASLSPRQKTPCCFQGPNQRNLLFVPSTKHPPCVYLQLSGSMVSRGRNSLQLVFCFNKGFHRQSAGADKFRPSRRRQDRVPRNHSTNTHTVYSLTCAHTQQCASLAWQAPPQQWLVFFLCNIHSALTLHKGYTVVFHHALSWYGIPQAWNCEDKDGDFVCRFLETYERN